MRQYHQLVENILAKGNYRENRTSSDTISTFSQSYTIDLQEGFPLLTTKDMSGFRWNSLIHELLWYFSGEHHIRDLKEETGIWNAWADDDWNLPTAYGRFWRRFPIPEKDAHLEGEWWPNRDDWHGDAESWYDLPKEKIEEVDRWVNYEEGGRRTFDQVQYVIDTLNGDHPYRSANSRRLVISAWHPANAAVSKLPPCHFTWVLNVQDGKLNTHLTQRSGDTALGIPFNIAAYALITHIIANQTPFEVGKFSHTVVDAHVYCGKGERGQWYSENMDELSRRVREASTGEDYLEVKEWLVENSPEEAEGEERYDHVPGLLEQLSREPRDRPVIQVAEKSIDDLEFEDVQVEDYDPHPGIKFAVAE